MVKRIFFGALILILLMQVGFAENSTLIDSYSYDFIADGTTVTMLDQIDTDEKTTITFELNTTAGNIEVSSVLGIISVDQTFFTEGSEVVSVEFNKVLAGEEKFLLTIYNEDIFTAFITKDMIIENNVELSATPESLITINDILYVTFDIQTNMEITDSIAKIISKEGTIYQSTSMTMENNKITYAFNPQESSEYNLYEISVNGYMKEFNHPLGTFDFSPISNFKESKTDEGLLISFDSDCSTCDKEITLLSEEDEYVYSETISSDSLTIAANTMYAMEINGPYKVVINYNSVDYEYVTQSYTYGDFETVVTEEPIVEEPVVEETTSDSSSSSTPTEETTTNETTPEETTEMTEEIDVVEEMMEEDSEEMTEEISETDVVEESTTSDEPKNNLLTGFSVSNVKDFANQNKSMVWGGLALIIVLGVLLIVYVKGRKDAYLYEM